MSLYTTENSHARTETVACLACGDHAVQVGVIEDDRNPCVYFSVMCLCGMHGPDATTEEAAIAAWNSLPRALTWGNEPPKVAGKYYQRFWFGDHWGEPDIITVVEWSIGKIRQNEDVQWSDGPIPMPTD